MRTRSWIAATVCGAILLLTSVAWADYQAYTRTPKGSYVPVIVMTWDYSAEELSAMNSYWASAYPQATVVASASRKYNCHSYAWYAQRATSVWINSPSKYWTDGSYTRVYTSSPSQYNKVYYPGGTSGDHSAVAQGYGVAISKWGQAPRMRHKLAYGPYESMTTFRVYRLSP